MKDTQDHKDSVSGATAEPERTSHKVYISGHADLGHHCADSSVVLMLEYTVLGPFVIRPSMNRVVDRPSHRAVTLVSSISTLLLETSHFSLDATHIPGVRYRDLLASDKVWDKDMLKESTTAGQ